MPEYYLTKDELYHHGIQGQKWGIRRWQNEDGSLTPAGREHYGFSDREKKRYQQLKKKPIKNMFQAKEQIRLYNKQQRLKNLSKDEMQKEIKEHDAQVAKNQTRLKKAAVIGAAAVATGLAAYGAYKYVQFTKEKAYKSSLEAGRDALSSITSSYHNELMRLEVPDSLERASNFRKEMMKDVERSARDNSSSFKRAREYLKGTGRRFSTSELEKMGIKSLDINRSAETDDALDIYRKARAMNNYETAKYRDEMKRYQDSLNKTGLASNAFIPYKKRKK